MSVTYDPATGEVITGDDGCPHCAQAVQERIRAERDLQLVELDLRNERREAARLKTQLKKQQLEAKDYRVAEALFRYWVARCEKNAKTSTFGDKRRDAVLKALRHKTPEFIARAIDGTAAAAATNSPERERLALIKVMQEAMQLVTEDQAAALRKTYKDAMKGTTRYDELELICRDEVQLERRHEIAERVGAPTLVGHAWLKEFGSDLPPTDHGQMF